MMASARASAGEREQVYAKLQLSMATLQLDKLQMELDHQAAAEGEDDSLMDHGVDMELDEDLSLEDLSLEDLSLEDGDDSGAALVTEQVQTRSGQKSRTRPRHGVRSGQSDGGSSVATALEELEEAVAISSVFAGPAPQSQPFAGHRCVCVCVCYRPCLTLDCTNDMQLCS
jgi:hypothetical protein